jgi:hypothetical protein
MSYSTRTLGVGTGADGATAAPDPSVDPVAVGAPVGASASGASAGFEAATSSALGVVGSLLIAAEEAIEETPADHRVAAGARVDAARAPMRPSDG